MTRNTPKPGRSTFWARPYGLPRAASTHLTYRYWEPPVPDALTLVVVGHPIRELARSCRSLDLVATLHNDAGVRNEELGAPVSICRLSEPFGVWARLV